MLTPYSDEDLTEQLEKLDSDKVYGAFKKDLNPSNLTSAASAMLQGLRPDRPDKEQCIGLSGNGFLPYQNEKGEIIPASEIEKIQIDYLKTRIEEAHKAHPTSPIVFTFIEGDKQVDKVAQLHAFVDKINGQVAKNKISLIVEQLDKPEHENIRNLFRQITRMEDVAKRSDSKNDKEVIFPLVNNLNGKILKFLGEHVKAGTCSNKDLIDFQQELRELIQKSAAKLEKQKIWKPIIANLLLVIGTLGLAGVVLAIRTLAEVYVAHKEKRGLKGEHIFFFAETKNQQALGRVERSLHSKQEKDKNPDQAPEQRTYKGPNN